MMDYQHPWWLDWIPLINLVLIPIAMVAVSAIRKIRSIDLHDIGLQFSTLIEELKNVKLQINALELRVARLEGIIMKAAGVHKGD